MRILVIEDEPRILDFLRLGLEAEGFVVDAADDGALGLQRALDGAYELVILDLLLPRLDGLRVLSELRQARADVPVLILSARSDLPTKLRGFDLGATDYMTKPVALDELLARLRALARRGPVERPVTLVVGRVSLDPAARTVRLGGREVALSAKEFALLEAFMERPGEVLSRLALLERAWDEAYENRSNVIDVYVRYLRAKLGRDLIETVRGAGYRLRA